METSPTEEHPERLGVDLLEAGLLPPLPAAYLRGEDRDLLAPLELVEPGEAPPGREPPAVDRQELADALEATNRAYGHPRAGDLAAKLARPETRVVIAGQQPGLFGGPLYTLSKMVAVRRWADELEAAGEPTVPVFWVATEDHDYQEVSRATLFTSEGVESFELGADPEPLVPVGMRTLGEGLEEVYAALSDATHGGRYEDWIELLQRWYRPDVRFGEAFCRLMVHFLGDGTPLLLDAMLPAVKAAQAPHLARLVERRRELDRALTAADREISSRGYELQVNPQPGVSPLFLLHEGKRRRVEWDGETGYRLRGAEGTRGTVDDLLERIADNPATVSPGVLARPALQDAILGTRLQVLGPGELSYMPQAAPVYGELEVAAPAVTLRPQALVLESHLVDKLGQTALRLADVMGDARRLERLLAERAGDDRVGPARERIEEILDELKGPALELDPNLERPWEKTRDQMLRALDRFADKVTSAAARRNEVLAQRVEQLRETCLPEEKLQERVISSSHFPGKYREGFADAFYRQLHLDPRTLQVIVP